MVLCVRYETTSGRRSLVSSQFGVTKVFEFSFPLHCDLFCFPAVLRFIFSLSPGQCLPHCENLWILIWFWNHHKFICILEESWYLFSYPSSGLSHLHIFLFFILKDIWFDLICLFFGAFMFLCFSCLPIKLFEMFQESFSKDPI